MTNRPLYMDRSRVELLARSEIVRFLANGEETKQEDLLERFDRGERLKLEIEAVVFRQSKTPRPLPKEKAEEANKNFFYFAPDEMRGFAESFGGRPMLRDHSERLDDVGGRITSSVLVETDDEYIVRQTIEMTRRWAIEAFLEGVAQKFSIGAEPASAEATATCSVCSTRMSWWWGCLSGHYPGQAVDLDGGAGSVIVEVRCAGYQGRETSAVVFPAVEGTSVDDLKALSQQDHPMKQILQTLKLSEGADEAAIVGAIVALKRDADAAGELKAQLDAKSEELEKARTALSELKVKSEADAEARKKEQIKVLHERALSGEGYGGALFAPKSKMEAYFLKLAERSIEEAEAYLGTLEPTAVGAAKQLTEEDPETPAPAIAQLSARERKFLERTGMTAEQYLAANADEYGSEPDDDAEDA